MITKKILQAEISDLYCDIEGLNEAVNQLQKEITKLKKAPGSANKPKKGRGRPRKEA